MPAVLPPALPRALRGLLGGTLVGSAALALTAAPAVAAEPSHTTQSPGITVSPGTPVDFHITVIDDAQHLPYEPVNVFRRPAGAQAFTLVATVRTDNEGHATYSFVPSGTADYMAVFPGDLTHTGSHPLASTVAVYDRGQQVVAEAARHYGAPYSYGAAGPYTFDCSGFTQYVYGRFGITLPHNDAAQYDVVQHIPVDQKQPGDLIFLPGHVGIYAGDGQFWAATHTGDIVRLEPIYSSDYRVGRP